MKISCGVFYLVWLVISLIEIFFLGSLILTTWDGESPNTISTFHILCFVVYFVLNIINIWVLICDACDDQEIFESLAKMDENYNYYINIKKEVMKKYVKWTLIVVCLFIAISGIKSTYNDTVKVFNKSAIYHNQYTQKVSEREMFYDKLWKTYDQKSSIAKLNKETFISVTQIIMNNRADGKNLAWKWLQENQQIPYDQFSMFYSDLSSYIERSRDDYFKIEKECQNIVNSNNMLLDTFPNNIYNKILCREKMKYEYGFTSNKTEIVFKTKKENI